jgi:excisionase family DNA binding protein
MMPADDDDLQAAYFLAHRFVDPMQAAGRPINEAIRNYAQKVDLMWERSASGPLIHDGSGQSELPYNVAQAAAKMAVTERHVRRLAKKGDLDARKHGRDWLIPQRAVDDYLDLEARRNGRAAGSGS